MKSQIKAKAVIFLIAVAFITFFSNDFGLIDLGKTAIITAIAIDKGENDEYDISAQLAISKGDNSSNENENGIIKSSGKTVAAALKKLGDLSGWYPQLSFCNVIIMSSEIAKENTIKVVDYFSKTLRVQDSAQILVALDKAGDLISKPTPLDEISSFGIQKVLLKDQGFDTDTVNTDIKTFSKDYYGVSKSSIIPILKKTQDEKGKTYFEAFNSALFYEGKMVGELDEIETRVYNILINKYNGSTLTIANDDEPKTEESYLLTVENGKSKISLDYGNKIGVNFDLSLFLKISDLNKSYSDTDYIKNKELPKIVKEKTYNLLSDTIKKLVSKSVDTSCDFLNLKKQFYKFNNKDFDVVKDNFFNLISPRISINFK